MLNNPIIMGGGSLPSLTNPGTAGDLLTGKQLIDQNGNALSGTMANRGAVSHSMNAGESYTIPAGYHNGSGRVTANSLSSQTSGTATAADINNGKTAWVNGVKLTGTGSGGSGEKAIITIRTDSSLKADTEFFVFFTNKYKQGDVKSISGPSQSTTIEVLGSALGLALIHRGDTSFSSGTFTFSSGISSGGTTGGPGTYSITAATIDTNSVTSGTITATAYYV